MQLKNVVVIDGCRTPFLRSGTDFKDLMSFQLGQIAIKGLVDRTGIDPKIVDRVILGTTISNVKTGNVAREAALTAGIPYQVPCHTVTLACISANQAITSGYDMIATGQADVVIAGGTDCVSDIPILFNKQMRNKLFESRKLKSAKDYAKFAFTLRPSDFKPETPSISEFITGRSMGEDCDILAARYGITREEQDHFAVRSHHLAAKATQDGHLREEIVAAELPPKFAPITRDNGVRGDSTYEKMASLKPVFFKKHGTLTAANSSYLTDGAAVVLIMSEEKAKELNLKPKSRIHAFAYSAQDPYEELLLGPAYASAKVLEKAKMKLDDIDVFEFHEAFAGQILANLKCMASEDFAKNKLKRDKPVGEVPVDKLNVWGGSLSLGHPFGATGARLVTTASNRLIKENKKYAMIAACAGGAHGHAMILERYSES